VAREQLLSYRIAVVVRQYVHLTHAHVRQECLHHNTGTTPWSSANKTQRRDLQATVQSELAGVWPSSDHVIHHRAG
jgi:hypothetical protein